MTEQEKIDLAIDLAKAAITNNTVKICSDPNKPGLTFLVHTASYREGERNTGMSFKALVEYFKNQLEDIII